jgi:hypothetical protein
MIIYKSIIHQEYRNAQNYFEDIKIVLEYIVVVVFKIISHHVKTVKNTIVNRSL